MKKQQYIAAVACLVAGAIGFASVYATEKGQERKHAAQQQETQQTSRASNEVKPKTNVNPAAEQAKAAQKVQEQRTAEEETAKEKEEEKEPEETAKEDKKPEETVPTAKADTLHFDKTKTAWPIEGEILLDYSMDATIFFPTLEVYRYNPAMVIGGAVNDKVISMAKGKIIDISENEVTGCTVKQDLGDGYTAVYGQLKELNFAKGDMVEQGQTLGYVNEPTKYYVTEGSNVYFALEKDGEAVNPKDYLPEMSMETLE